MRPGDAGTAFLNEIRQRLLAWWERNQRRFPWRETRDPWRVLLAEVLLHRTRADQVVPVYQAALERFPDPADLAESSPGELEALLYPLGLHWRVPLLREMARQIVREHGGRIPEDRETLMALPGVGDYIAGAVRCFALGVPEPILDTSTVRVVGRIWGLPVRDSSRRSRRFRQLMEAMVRSPDPRSVALALLDLAALVCRPGVPECEKCPLTDLCQFRRAYGNTQRTSDRPRP